MCKVEKLINLKYPFLTKKSLLKIRDAFRKTHFPYSKVVFLICINTNPKVPLISLGQENISTRWGNFVVRFVFDDPKYTEAEPDHQPPVRATLFALSACVAGLTKN